MQQCKLRMNQTVYPAQFIKAYIILMQDGERSSPLQFNADHYYAKYEI